LKRARFGFMLKVQRQEQEFRMQSFRHTVSAIALLALCAAAPVLTAAPAFAAGSEDGSSNTGSAATYAQAKAAVYAGKFAEARVMLVAITAAEPKNADAWNLLGFSSRKTGDLKAASKAYTKALKLNPGHLGALEYQGEMCLQLGQPDKAKANLDKLQGLCGNCVEKKDLEKALQAAGVV